ncbi:hypothetical protein BJD99_19120 [Rhodococcus sp. 1163]|uniref:helix-turn-helix domain-containing protein n=1 Tax=Rhodococcus sp. 1163 TaxID=1905289 RepID=UPI000A040157|nr:helix-turn-helix domain-containing protein [Rhodococcus sp. 1163]ORI18855.1 hypothetical protein BJD99_19120 [Rhodococcus sp. 1163]
MNKLVQPPDPLLKPDEAAAFLRIEVATLVYWRCRKTGPRFVRIGDGRGAIRYRTSDLVAYLDQNSSDNAA